MHAHILLQFLPILLDRSPHMTFFSLIVILKHILEFKETWNDSASALQYCMRPFQAYLLVDDDKALLPIGTDFVLEADDLLHAIFNELPLRSHKLLPLLSTLVEEARVDLSLFILQRDVAGQHVGILHPLLHVRVSGTVVQHQTSDQPKKEEKDTFFRC